MAFDIRPRIRRAFRLALRRRDLTDAEIDDELRFHIDMRVARLVSQGTPAREAIAEARGRFGRSWDEAVERLHEAGHAREERLTLHERLDGWWNDLRYATRNLVRQRSFALVVIVTFALGIGANVTLLASSTVFCCRRHLVSRTLTSLTTSRSRSLDPIGPHIARFTTLWSRRSVRIRPCSLRSARRQKRGSTPSGAAVTRRRFAQAWCPDPISQCCTRVQRLGDC